MFIDDEWTEGIPEQILQLLRAAELEIMLDICRRIKATGSITRTADYQIERLRHMSAFRGNYERAMKRVLNLSDEELRHLYEDLIAKGYARDQSIYEAVGAIFTPFEDNAELQQLIRAVEQQTHDELQNLTQTTGFIDFGTRQEVPLNQYFVNVLDKVHTEVSSGAFTYDQAVQKAVSDMVNSGMRADENGERWINYDNPGKRPWHNRLDVAARRAILTGLNQVTGKISEDNARKLETEYFEVSAHATARPSHMLWQGRVYTKEQLHSICGLGEVTGLQGANCRHHYDAFIPGVSVRNYTDEQLEAMRQKALELHEYNGKRYTLYEATQRQRQLETQIRAQNQRIRMLKEAGASDQTIENEEIRKTSLYREYREFSQTMGLPQQFNRINNYTKGLNLLKGSVFEGSTGKPTGPSEPITSLIEGASNAITTTPAVPTIEHAQAVSEEKDIDANMPQIPNAVSNLKDWPIVNEADSKQFVEMDKGFDLDGVHYDVDGINVIYDPSGAELRCAEMLASKYGKDVMVIPRVIHPENVSTSDYLIDGFVRYDLKSPEGYKGIYNRLDSDEKQSERFVIDITNLFDDSQVLNQIKRVFSSKYTAFVKEVVLFRDYTIVYSYMRK